MRIVMNERENMWRQLLFFSKIPTSYLVEEIYLKNFIKSNLLNYLN